MTTDYFTRWQEAGIKQALTRSRVLVVSGPRQSGKTTLIKGLKNENKIFRTLDDLNMLQMALSDPHGFVRHNSSLLIIDEIQRAPLLLQAIKLEADENPVPGRYLITGSSNIQSLPGVTESLAGRIHKHRLRSLAMGEIYRHTPDFIPQAFKGIFNVDPLFIDYTKEEYLKDALHGGYPEPRTLDSRGAQYWFKNYLDALIERDLKDILNLRRQDNLYELLHVTAAWSSKFMNISDIGTGLSITRPTLESYLNALEALFLIERVRPWSKTDYDRVNRHDKLFMTDTGLMASLLKWKLESLLLDGQKNGKLIETFVFTQLSAHLEAQEEEYNLFHYRDREQREIDFIIENEDGDLLAIEVKASAMIDKEAFKHLYWFKNNLVKNRKFIGIVLYTGKHVISFGEGCWAVPISILY